MICIQKVFVKWSKGTKNGFSGDNDLFTSGERGHTCWHDPMNFPPHPWAHADLQPISQFVFPNAVQHLLPGIEEAKVLLDRDSGRVRKAGFFTFGTEEQAMACTRMRFIKVSGRNTIFMHVAEGNSPGSRFDLDKFHDDDDDGRSFSYGPDRRRNPGRNASDFDHRMPPFYRRRDQGRRHGKLGGNQQQPTFEYQHYHHSPVEYQHYFWSQAQIAYQFHLQQCMQAHHFAQQKMALGFHDMACQQQFNGFSQVRIA